MDGLIDTAGDSDEPRCPYEIAPYVRCIRIEGHPAEHFFILPESFFTLTKEGKR